MARFLVRAARQSLLRGLRDLPNTPPGNRVNVCIEPNTGSLTLYGYRHSHRTWWIIQLSLLSAWQSLPTLLMIRKLSLFLISSREDGMTFYVFVFLFVFCLCWLLGTSVRKEAFWLWCTRLPHLTGCVRFSQNSLDYCTDDPSSQYRVSSSTEHLHWITSDRIVDISILTCL